MDPFNIVKTKPLNWYKKLRKKQESIQYSLKISTNFLNKSSSLVQTTIILMQGQKWRAEDHNPPKLSSKIQLKTVVKNQCPWGSPKVKTKWLKLKKTPLLNRNLIKKNTSRNPNLMSRIIVNSKNEYGIKISSHQMIF